MIGINEVAKGLGCHIETIRRLCRKNAIGYVKLGKEYRFESVEKVKQDLAAYHNK